MGGGCGNTDRDYCDLQDGFSPRFDFKAVRPEEDHDSDDDDDDYDDEGASWRFSSFLSLLRLRIGYLMELILVIIPSLLES